jgi:hypothetical protein
MKAYNEKCDRVLLYLKDRISARWDTFSKDTGVKKDDAVITYLNTAKGFVKHSDKYISISNEGQSFISKTSFVEQRKTR